MGVHIEDKMVVIKGQETFYFYFYLPKDVDLNLNREIEFILKLIFYLINESLAEHKKQD